MSFFTSRCSPLQWSDRCFPSGRLEEEGEEDEEERRGEKEEKEDEHASKQKGDEERGEENRWSLLLLNVWIDHNLLAGRVNRDGPDQLVAELDLLGDARLVDVVLVAGPDVVVVLHNRVNDRIRRKLRGSRDKRWLRIHFGEEDGKRLLGGNESRIGGSWGETNAGSNWRRTEKK